MAITASARKVVTIAVQMLKHNEPYRYAIPKATQDKLAHVRFSATATRRKPVPQKTGEKSGENLGQRVRCSRSLPQIYQDEGLPPVKPVEQLPAGERRVLKEAGVTGYVRQIQRSPRR